MEGNVDLEFKGFSYESACLPRVDIFPPTVVDITDGRAPPRGSSHGASFCRSVDYSVRTRLRTTYDFSLPMMRAGLRPRPRNITENKPKMLKTSCLKLCLYYFNNNL